MRFVNTAFILLIAVFIILIDLPENLNVRFRLGGRTVRFTVNPLKINARVLGMNIQKEFKTHLGLDLQGGSRLTFQADTTKVTAEDLQDALNSARDIVEKRVNFFGVSEPVVQTLKSGNNYRITVDLPGIKNVDEAIALIGKTAQLTFREEATSEAQIATNNAQLLELTKDTGLNGGHVKKASVTFNPQTGNPEVSLSFTQEGADLFAKLTQRIVGKPLAIFIDNFLISAPTVNVPITDGNAVITGSFTLDEAKNLALSINSGALPLPIKLIEQRNIGPSLGAIEVKKSIFAGSIGLLMVLVFMMGYYGRLGVIASVALLIYGLITLAIFRIIPITLTLPGVAGFILSIGMAVDANILIFERIKEETRKGQPLDIAVRLGFGRAIDAIKDANITTILVALILFNPLNWEFFPQFGLVRGFAITLLIGVITSLFTGVVITKRLLNIFYLRKQHV